MFWMQLNTLIDILNIMLEYGIEPMNILKDLWAFRYPLDCVRDRLERANTAKKIKMMPWMVRCPEKIFQRYATYINEVKFNYVNTDFFYFCYFIDQ